MSIADQTEAPERRIGAELVRGDKRAAHVDHPEWPVPKVRAAEEEKPLGQK